MSATSVRGPSMRETWPNGPAYSTVVVRATAVPSGRKPLTLTRVGLPWAL
jgi:hypothetical protein